MRGAGVIFFAYIGFDAVSTAAQESKNPQRDMPRGIIGSLIICTILYVLVSGVMVGLVPYQQLGVPAPMALAVDAARVKAAGSSWQSLLDLMPFVVKLGAIMGLSSTIIVQMMAQPRIFFAMGKDGLLPAWASTIHPRFRTPHVTTLITGGIVMLASGFTRDRRAGRAGQHRHAVRVRDRVDRRDRAAQNAPGLAAPVQDPVRAGVADRLGAGVAGVDGRAARGQPGSG